jgi:UDP-N-acetylglucosamine 2-epimerase (non-hydrolysing)
MNAKLVISDSGSLTEETSILDIKSIILRDTFERQEGLDKSTAIMCPVDLKSFKKTVKLELSSSKKLNKKIEEYENPDFSENLCRIIATKIPYIKKYIWNKSYV